MRKIAAILLAAALIAGCSALRFAYENAELYLRYRANAYLDLDSAQSAELEARIREFLAWHRAHALPKYASDAEDAARRLADGLSHDDLFWGYDSFAAHVRESLHAAAERIAPLLDRLTPEQVAYLEKGFAADNRRFEREFLRGSEQERRRRRARRLQERLEGWVGNLSQAQVERVNEYAASAPLLAELDYAARGQLQAEVLAMVRAREASTRLAGRLEQWRRERESALRANSAPLVALLTDLDRSLSAEQRATAQERLRRHAADLRELAQRP